ncbi:putative anion transporter 3, chloroplastic [Asimina triloba]
MGGALADKYGGKRVMAWGVGIWSIATFLTPWAADHSTATLLAARALFGLAEGVALPSMNTLLSRWFPSNERASAVGISMAGFHLGNVISLLATPIIMSRVGTSGPFALFSSLGFLWLSIWAVGITNDPQDCPFISQEELRLIQAGKANMPTSNGELPSIRKLFSKLPTWAIVVANVTNNWVFDVNLKQAAWFSAIPWGMMAISGYVAGSASDLLIKLGYSVTVVRKIMQTPSVAAMFLTAALSLSSFSQAGFLLNMQKSRVSNYVINVSDSHNLVVVVLQDIAPQYAGFLHGITNAVGTGAAIVSTIGTGYFVQWLGSFQAFLTVTAVLYFITTIFWNLYATAERHRAGQCWMLADHGSAAAFQAVFRLQMSDSWIRRLENYPNLNDLKSKQLVHGNGPRFASIVWMSKPGWRAQDAACEFPEAVDSRMSFGIDNGEVKTRLETPIRGMYKLTIFLQQGRGAR